MILLATFCQGVAAECELKIKSKKIAHKLSSNECALVLSRDDALAMRIRRTDSRIIEDKDEALESIWIVISHTESIPDVAEEYSALVPARRSNGAEIYSIKNREVWVFKGLDGNTVRGGSRGDSWGGIRTYNGYVVFYTTHPPASNPIELDELVLRFLRRLDS